MWLPNETPWVDRLLAETWDRLEARVGPLWMPRPVRPGEASWVEFGCGEYGCGLPTHDGSVILKLTRDFLEASYASMEIWTDGIIHDPLTLDIAGTRYYAIWREKASRVGDEGITGDPFWLDMMQWRFHATIASAQVNFPKVGWQKRAARARKGLDVVKGLEGLERIIFADPGSSELTDLAVSLYKLATEDGVLLPDIHYGNLGRVPRTAGVVLTDPGRMGVIDPELEIPEMEEV